VITAAGATHVGRVRTVNEDAFYCSPESGLFIVADGMGGHQAGEVASALAVEAIRTFFTRTRDGDSVTWPYGIDPKLSFEANRMVTAVKLANRRVFRVSESPEGYTGMGTTVVAMTVAEGRAIIASVGDSRAYSCAGGTLVQLTEDDTWVRMAGTVDPEMIARHPMRHVLTNVVGARELIDLSVSERVLDAPETFLLSTDGLHGVVDDDDISTMLQGSEPPEVLAERLVNAALDGGSRDNITALVIRYQPAPA
jgi:protein phosphatase